MHCWLDTPPHLRSSSCKLSLQFVFCLGQTLIFFRFIHLFFFIYNIRGFYTSITAGFAVHHCPNCRSEVVIGQTQQSQTTDRAGANYSLLRGEDYLDADADAVPYADARDSEEQMRPEADDKAEKESKGKGIIEV